MNDTPEEDIKDIEDKVLSAEEEIEAAIEKSNFKEKKARIRKTRIRLAILSVFILLIGWFIKWYMTPYQGSMAFGVCNVFLELTVRYPKTLRLSTVEETDKYVRIWYTQTDSFGEYRMEPIQCSFKEDETYGFILDKVAIRRRDVDPKIVDAFNKSLPVILSHSPSLSLPTPLPDSLKDLQIETHLFRKPIL